MSLSLRTLRVAAPLASLLFATLPLAAQQPLPRLDDPANLAGERVSPPDLADTLPIDHGAPALEQLLRKLRTRASFMLIVAHPDDEDGGMLTYLSRGQGARVAMLTLNRGEGGQNLMSGDFDDALGLIRTQELLAADRYMAVDQFFGTEVDFGFSKTKEEAFAKWTHDRVLYDAVRAIRLYRPLVIASVFIGAATDGHGQHQVSGEIAQEAFVAAGDPTVFPDQIAQGLAPWQPLKVYARIPFARIDAQGMYDYATSQYTAPRFENYVTGKVTDTVGKANVVVPEGTPDALLGGLSYVQFARQGLALQRTQIGQNARPAAAGRSDVSYHRYGSRVLGADGRPQPNDGAGDAAPESGFFDGIDTSLPGIASLAPEVAAKFRPPLEKIDQQIADAQSKFDPNHMDAIAPQLRNALGALDAFIKELNNPAVNDLPPTESFNLLHELRIKRVQLNNALAIAASLNLTATLDSGGRIVSDQRTVSVQAAVADGSGQSVALKALDLTVAGAHAAGASAPIPAQSSIQRTLSVENPKGFSPTRPYFSRPDIEQPFYNIANPALRNAPATPPPATVQAQLDFGGVPVYLAATVSVPTRAGGLQPAVVVPPVSISIDPHTEILPSDKPTVGFNVIVQPPQTAFAVDAPSRWKGLPTSTAASFPGLYSFLSEVPSPDRQPITLHATAKRGDGHDYFEGYRPVGYGDLPRTNYYTPATLRVVPVDVTTAPGLNVAYLPGTGDDVPTSLAYLGVTPHLLTLADLTPESLKQYDAVILGVRAYVAHPELAGPGSQPLLQYAAAGGVVIVQYNNARFGAAEAPFPITVAASSGDHAHDVIDETAPVSILAPENPLLTWPNRITPADFDHWVEERGHSFAATWAPEYQALLECHDPGQLPQDGGLLVAHTGKGAWIYLGFALYRQLPEAVPGPYRLFANLISAARNPRFLSAAPPTR